MNKKLATILLFIGIFLVFDGAGSLYTQWDDGDLFNLGRFIRLGLGVYLVWIGYLKKEMS